MFALLVNWAREVRENRRIDVAREWLAFLCFGVTGLIFGVLMWLQGQGSKILARGSNKLALQSNQLAVLQLCAAKVGKLNLDRRYGI